MPKTSEITSFTKDVQGRYLCNDFFEAESWRRDGGRPFDFVVIGGGTFGAAIAEHHSRKTTSSQISARGACRSFGRCAGTIFTTAPASLS